jgi:hypothetical protein
VSGGGAGDQKLEDMYRGGQKMATVNKRSQSKRAKYR